jgi:hypothetical protein
VKTDLRCGLVTLSGQIPWRLLDTEPPAQNLHNLRFLNPKEEKGLDMEPEVWFVSHIGTGVLRKANIKRIAYNGIC